METTGMKVTLKLSGECRTRELTDNACALPQEVTLTIDEQMLSEMTRHARSMLSLTNNQTQISLTKHEVGIYPRTAGDWEQALKQYQGKVAEQEAEAKAEEERCIAECAEVARMRLLTFQNIIAGELTPSIAFHRNDGYSDMPLERYPYGSSDRCIKAGNAVAGLTSETIAEAARIWREAGEKLVAAEKERREAIEEAEMQAKAVVEQDRLEWIAAHGSERLRLAVENGYNCQRLYVTERAAVEHPDYTADFDDNAQWDSRSCPSEAALKEAIAVGGEVVWLTKPPLAKHDEDFDCYDWEEREAVVIRDFLGNYDLVKEF